MYVFKWKKVVWINWFQLYDFLKKIVDFKNIHDLKVESCVLICRRF